MRKSALASPFGGQNLRLKIGAGFALLALVVFGVVGWLSGQQARAQVTEDLGAAMALVAGRLVTSLDTDMFERYREVQNLAQLDGVIGGPSEPQRWRTVLDKLQQTYPHYAWIGVVDIVGGTVLASTGGVLEGRSVADRPWFKNAQRKPFVGDVHDAVMLSKLLPPSPTGEPLRLVDVAAPIVRDGQVVAVLGAHLSWAWAEERRRFVLQPMQTFAGIDAAVVNGRGELLLPPVTGADVKLPPAAFARLSRSGPSVETWSDGRQYLSAVVASVGYRQYPGLGWAVAVRQPVESAMEPARRVERQIWSLGLLGATLFGLLGWWLAGRLSAPLQRLARQASTLVATEWQPPQAAPVPRRDEVAQLADTLGALMDRLQARGAELTQLNQGLEERVRQRTTALEQANDDLKSFSRSVSHDLKAPMGSIATATRQVLEREGDRLQPSSRQALSVVADECDRLSQLVDELMTLAQVEHHTLQWAEVPMAELARAAVDRAGGSDTVAPLASRPPELVFGELPSAPGDRVLLQQVWQNLVSNAFKFSRRAGAPRIEISAEAVGNELIYSVSDNGSGFDMNQSARLFGVFQRLHRYSDFPGTGLGLSIVKRIVHRHGGRVWAHSVPGQKTSFYFALPREPLRDDEAEATAPVAQPT